MTRDQFIDELMRLTRLHGSQALDLIHDQLDREDQEREARYAEMALNQEHRIARIERTPAYSPQGQPIGESDQIAEVITVRQKDLPEFARQHGLDEQELRDTLEARRKETVGRGRERYQGYPLRWVDRSLPAEVLAEREQDLQDDERFARKSKEREANKQKARPRVPVLSSFLGGPVKPTERS